MILEVLAVGKLRSPSCRSLCDEYKGRIGFGFRAAEREVADARGDDPPRAVAAEGERLVAAVEGASRVIVLDGEGRTYSTEAFARLLGTARDSGLRSCHFVVGGAWGLSQPIRDRATDRVALSAFTLPHELARVVLWEQLYRATTVLAGAPYHHGGRVG